MTGFEEPKSNDSQPLMTKQEFMIRVLALCCLVVRQGGDEDLADMAMCVSAAVGSYPAQTAAQAGDYFNRCCEFLGEIGDEYKVALVEHGYEPDRDVTERALERQRLRAAGQKFYLGKRRPHV